MNHTERIIHVSRQVRGLTREHARQAVEFYLESVAEEAATGDTVVLPSIGRLRVACFKNGGKLKEYVSRTAPAIHDAGFRLQTCVRLDEKFKAACRAHLLSNAKLADVLDRNTISLADYPATTRVEPGQTRANRVQPGSSKVPKHKKER